VHRAIANKKKTSKIHAKADLKYQPLTIVRWQLNKAVADRLRARAKYIDWLDASGGRRPSNYR
jgi:hypothetical protein